MTSTEIDQYAWECTLTGDKWRQNIKHLAPNPYSIK